MPIPIGQNKSEGFTSIDVIQSGEKIKPILKFECDRKTHDISFKNIPTGFQGTFARFMNMFTQKFIEVKVNKDEPMSIFVKVSSLAKNTGLEPDKIRQLEKNCSLDMLEKEMINAFRKGASFEQTMQKLHGSTNQIVKVSNLTYHRTNLQDMTESKRFQYYNSKECFHNLIISKASADINRPKEVELVYTKHSDQDFSINFRKEGLYYDEHDNSNQFIKISLCKDPITKDYYILIPVQDGRVRASIDQIEQAIKKQLPS